jgi:hypothetical protein
MYQRASLSVEKWVLNGIGGDGAASIQYTIKNAGRTPAFVDTIRYGFRTGSLPSIPNYQGTSLRHCIPISAGSSLHQPQDISYTTVNLLRAAREAGQDWWYYIRIEYHDRFGG